MHTPQPSRARRRREYDILLQMLRNGDQSHGESGTLLASAASTTIANMRYKRIEIVDRVSGRVLKRLNPP